MKDPHDITERVWAFRRAHQARDERQRQVMSIREGDYRAVAGDLFPDDFDQAMVANLVDTAARDIAEVMAPLPSFNCASVKMTSDAAKRVAQKRTFIMQGYLQSSHLADQMPSGADRYVSFGMMAYIVEPDIEAKMPYIRLNEASTIYYRRNMRRRVVEFAEVVRLRFGDLLLLYPDTTKGFSSLINSEASVDVVRWYDDEDVSVVMLEQSMELAHTPNLLGRCPVRVVERPGVGADTSGQFDGVIWVQVARALVQNYTMSALEQSVNAPLAMPNDVDSVEIGALEALRSDNPGSIGRVPLNLPPGLFPAQQELQAEQRVGSRYPEGRSGNIDASIITGQGVQALMGTFDTQIQTFQRLNATALEDVAAMCFEMDERLWPDREKTTRIKDSGTPYEITYTPSKDIAGNYDCDVSYGAIAGLDPNRALVFILQAVAAQLVSKDTARRELPVDLNVTEEEKQIDLEALRDSVVASLAALPQAIPQMVAAGQDPRDLVSQLVQIMAERRKGKPIEQVVADVFAPKQKPGATPPAAPPAPPGAPSAPGGPQAGGSPGQNLLMSLAGLTNSGNPNLQSNVSRVAPAA